MDVDEHSIDMALSAYLATPECSHVHEGEGQIIVDGMLKQGVIQPL